MSIVVFHRKLKAKDKGAKDWINSWTEVENLGGGKFGATVSVGHRVFKDKEDGLWKKHKVVDERPAKDCVVVQSAKCCVEVYPYYAKYFDVNHEEVRLYEERWVVQRLFKEPDTWRDVGAWNPRISAEETADGITVAVTYDTDYGSLVVIYIQRDGAALKHEVVFQNTSGGTETFRVLQRWAGIVGAKCNGKDIPLTIEDVREACFLRFHGADKSAKEFCIAENLWSMIFNPDETEKADQCLQRPVSVETHAQGMRADFIYGNWALAQDESLTVDPDTATLSDPTVDGHTSSTANIPNFTELRFGFYLAVCRGYVEWDVSSIPDDATISNTVFRYHCVSHGVGGHIHEMLGYRPSNGDAASIYAEAGEGTVYADGTGFPVVDSGQEIDLGTSADSDLQSQLSSDWFAIGMQSDDEGSTPHAVILSEEEAIADPPPTLYVEYSVGWAGKISGVVNPAKVMGVAVANISKVKGVS